MLVAQLMAPNRISTETANNPAYSKVRWKLDVRRILGRATDTIPCPSDRVDQLYLVALINLATQPADIGFDDVRARVEVNVPDVLEQHRTRDHLTGVAHQVFEQAEFPWLQLDQLAPTTHRVRQEVELQIEHAEARLRRSHARPSP